MEKRKEYHAIITEIDGEVADVVYVCDKSKNTQCRKTACGEFCNHTFDKKYALDFANGEDVHVEVTKEYAEGKLFRKTVEYKYGGKR